MNDKKEVNDNCPPLLGQGMTAATMVIFQIIWMCVGLFLVVFLGLFGMLWTTPPWRSAAIIAIGIPLTIIGAGQPLLKAKEERLERRELACDYTTILYQGPEFLAVWQLDRKTGIPVRSPGEQVSGKEIRKRIAAVRRRAKETNTPRRVSNK